MLDNIWTNIVEWFSDRVERKRLIRSFNDSAKNAFISGIAPTCLSARFSRGNPAFKHHLSNPLYHGFRITALSGKPLSREDLNMIGLAVMADEILIRKLVVLGFDTLEVASDSSSFGCRWQLLDLLQIGNNDYD